MTDKLLAALRDADCYNCYSSTMDEAADEIERLRAEKAELLAALHRLTQAWDAMPLEARQIIERNRT